MRRILSLAPLGVAFIAASIVCQEAAGQGFRARGPSLDRGNVAVWSQPVGFGADVFTFARIKYRSSLPEASSQAWWTDQPDADLNFSWRLHQLTALRVDPLENLERGIVELTDPRLCQFPFVFMSGVPAISLSDEEVGALRRYLLNGGFLMVDDFWGERNYQHFYDEVVKRALPEYEPEELPIDHPIFHCVFELKEKPQIPNVGFATRNRGSGRTWEVSDGQTPHYRGVSDARGRLMMLICHNTDLGDGWEEEATNEWYFTEFSEKKAYPLGINIVMYVMTH